MAVAQNAPKPKLLRVLTIREGLPTSFGGRRRGPAYTLYKEASVHDEQVPPDVVKRALQNATNRIAISIRPDVPELHSECWGASCEHAYHFYEERDRILEEAPKELHSLTGGYAYQAWENARAEIKRARMEAFASMRDCFHFVRVGIESMKVAEEMGNDRWVSPQDWAEAKLRRQYKRSFPWEKKDTQAPLTARQRTDSISV